VHHGIGGCHGPSWERAFNEKQAAAGLHVTFSEYSEVPARSPCFLNANSQIFDPPAASKLPTRLSRLGHLDERFSDLKYIPDTSVTLEYALGRKIFSE
jgi:hypothetical protein